MINPIGPMAGDGGNGMSRIQSDIQQGNKKTQSEENQNKSSKSDVDTAKINTTLANLKAVDAPANIDDAMAIFTKTEQNLATMHASADLGEAIVLDAQRVLDLLEG